MVEALTDAPWHVDAVLALVMVLAALAQYVCIALDGSSWSRWLLAIGWTGLAGRVLYALIVFGNVPIASVSVPFLVCIAGGTVLLAWNRIFAAGEPVVHCLQEPQYRCRREDRMREAIVQMQRQR